MTPLADSSACFDKERLLVQHQVALTLVQRIVANPKCSAMTWLDLACGKGQIITHLHHNLSTKERSKINLVAYDIENSYSKYVRKTAETLGFNSFRFEVGYLNRFWENYTLSGPWEFISLTNAIHEISPLSLAEIFVRSIERLSDQGLLFIYDMENLPDPELGAIPWSSDEIKIILSTLCNALGCNAGYSPPVGSWKHSTCTGWNCQLIRQHMDLASNFVSKIPQAITETSSKIIELLKSRLQRTQNALESLTVSGVETGEESNQKISLLYEFWAIHRFLGEMS